MKHNKLLTQKEVFGLPDGTHVIITWSGGNGPFEYIIKDNFAHTLFAPDIPIGLVGFVGDKPFNTHVSLVSEILDGMGVVPV